MKAVRPVRLELKLPEGASLRMGKLKEEVGHLEGRANNTLNFGYNITSPTNNRGKMEWIIHAPKGGAVSVHAVSERAGSLRREIRLESGVAEAKSESGSRKKNKA